MKKKFQVICADPPYGFSDRLRMSKVKRGAAANYPTMTIQDIIDLPVKDIIDPEGCILCLWVPSSLLPEGLRIMEAWGFTMKQTYIWVKSKKNIFTDLQKEYCRKVWNELKVGKYDAFRYPEIKKLFIDITKIFDPTNLLSFGMGRLFRNSHEICLIGTNNNKIYQQLQNKSQRTVCLAPNLKHSAKPENLQDSLDIMFPNKSINKIELFARRQRKGWLTIGNQNPTTMGEDIRVSLEKLK